VWNVPAATTRFRYPTRLLESFRLLFAIPVVVFSYFRFFCEVASGIFVVVLAVSLVQLPAASQRDGFTAAGPWWPVRCFPTFSTISRSDIKYEPTVRAKTY